MKTMSRSQQSRNKEKKLQRFPMPQSHGKAGQPIKMTARKKANYTEIPILSPPEINTQPLIISKVPVIKKAYVAR